MRQLLLLFVLTGGLLQTVSSQTDDKRTVTTKIADLLAKTPAEDAAQFNANAGAVAGLGEIGLGELVKKLDDNGDNSKIHFALSGFSAAATAPGKEDWRSLAVKTYGRSLQQLTSPESKLFIITQLEQLGKDDAIPYLQAYLQDARLSDPAARALATIGTDAAKSALLEALGNSSGNARISIVQALGDVRHNPAAAAIEQLASSSDAPTRKVALYALARIASPSSAKILEQAASRSGYSYSVDDANASYILYLNNLAANGNGSLAGKGAKTLQKKAKADNQVQTRIAALKLLADQQGMGSTSLLTGALKDKNAQYREAALAYAAPYLNESTAPQWLKTFDKAAPAAKAEILRALGNKKIAAALPVALKAINGNDANLKLAAITAAGQIGQQESLPAFLGVFKSGSDEDIQAVKSSLLSMKGDEVVKEISGALPDASPAGKAAIIEILGERGSNIRQIGLLDYVLDKDPRVSTAARAVLKKSANMTMALPVLALLQKETDPGNIKDWQQIAVTAFKRQREGAGSGPLLQAFKRAPQEKKPLFYAIVSGVGLKPALKEVFDSYDNSSDAVKKEVIAALSNWKDGDATTEAYKILKKAAGTSLETDAFNGFLRQVAASPATKDLKLIMLRNAMEYAKTDQQKRSVLRQVAGCNTFPAFLYASSFLDNASLKTDAASAVINIALSNNEIFGKDVAARLEKALGNLSGAEADYQKAAVKKHLSTLPSGNDFVPLFNEKDLTGWKGLVANPVKRAAMDAKTLTKEQAKADEVMRSGWVVRDGLLVFTGKGDNLCTVKKYGDFEMYVDWKITDDGDAGIYLRGTPQVQIWDTARVDVGAQVGSGGLYNNEKNPSKPLLLADNAIGDWNTFRILMVGDLVTVYLNGQLVVNGVPLENYWDRSLPIFPEEQIELQAHGTYVAYRDIYIREIERPKPYVLTPEEKKEGFKILFDGTNLHEWVGNKTAYVIEDGAIAVYPKRGGSGNLYTKDEYADFVYRFEFKLTPGANNGIGIRTPLKGDAAYEGMEIQVLDDGADIYKDLKDYQFHGSVYGIIPAKRGHLKPVGEWNEEEIYVKGSKIRVTLNGVVIVDGDLEEASKNGTLDKRDHPGLKNKKGHIGFLGHGDTLFFRNVRIRDLAPPPPLKKK
ncbi:MAG: DUF1080 domain-containing protein [Chitinophagaceae bacterium]|nr:DUF1080 domain-containing protein [Chitinophagaceae bacterium]MCW5928605.1 DUF1080 domain-containing protein [Chitinophagaceae bacterium]